MTNLTLSVDEDLLRRARLRALEQGTSVNAILRQYLEAYAGPGDERRVAIDRLLARSAHSTSRRGGRRWSRDELHER